MELVLDDREHGWHNAWRDKLKFQVQRLCVGDAQIRDSENSILSVIERKTWNDLSASIKDGRYRDQSARLSQMDLLPQRVIYLIEGDYTPSNFTLSLDTLKNACLSLNQRYGFTVVFSENMEKSLEFVQRMLLKLPQYLKEAREGKVLDRTFKKNRVTPSNVEVYMLAQIPGISFKRAEELIQLYGSMSDLENALDVTKGVADRECRGKKLGVRCENVLRKYLKS